jgi:hypothetical protein
MPSGQPPAPLVEALTQSGPPAERPKASETSLAPGRSLGSVGDDRPSHASSYLDDTRETEPIYSLEGLVHAGQILRLANNALVQNAVLGPWIHVGSRVRNHAAVRVGEKLTLRSKITSNVVSQGHAIVEFNAMVDSNGARSVAEITHTAVWRPRQVVDVG